jgi:hypothetical protein
MQKINRKIYVIALGLLFSTINGFGQDKRDLTFKDITFSAGVPYIDENLGLQISLGTSVSIENNIFKAFVSGAREFELSFGSSEPDNIQEYDLLYGRSFSISEKMLLEVYGGAGYVLANKNLKKEKLVGFPLQCQLIFPVQRKINFGIQLHSNINNFMSYFSLGFLMKLNFNK